MSNPHPLDAAAWRCACPSTDAQECVEVRYGVTDDEARDEPCECACHETDEDDDDF